MMVVVDIAFMDGMSVDVDCNRPTRCNENGDFHMLIMPSLPTLYNNDDDNDDDVIDGDDP
jgi:hypothetical protein